VFPQLVVDPEREKKVLQDPTRMLISYKGIQLIFSRSWISQAHLLQLYFGRLARRFEQVQDV
jgi:hypothetical protein